MFHNASKKSQSRGTNQAWSTIPLAFVGCLIFTSCAHIEVAPKDPQLEKFEAFARTVATNIYDANPQTYASSQAKLAGEVAPSVLAKLKSAGLAASSPADLKSKTAALSGSPTVKISTVDIRNTTPEQLVPFEIKGSVEGAPKEVKFDLTLELGINPKTKNPIVGGIDIK